MHSIHVAMILYLAYDITYMKKIASGVTVRGDCGVAGEGRVFGLPTFHSWRKCTMPLTNVNTDWMSNASSGLRIIIILYHN